MSFDNELNLVVFRRPRAQPPGPPPRPPPPPVRVRRQASPPRGRPRAPQTLSGMGPPLPAPRWLGPTFPPPVPSPKLWYLAAPTARLRPKKSMHVQVLPSVESWWVHTSYIKANLGFKSKWQENTCTIKESLWTFEMTAWGQRSWQAWMKTQNHKMTFKRYLLTLTGLSEIILCNQLWPARRACQFSFTFFTFSNCPSFLLVSVVVHGSYACFHFLGISLAAFPAQIWLHSENI